MFQIFANSLRMNSPIDSKQKLPERGHNYLTSLFLKTKKGQLEVEKTTFKVQKSGQKQKMFLVFIFFLRIYDRY
jgi:peptide methionine sulfoxide reductase MsrA